MICLLLQLVYKELEALFNEFGKVWRIIGCATSRIIIGDIRDTFLSTIF